MKPGKKLSVGQKLLILATFGLLSFVLVGCGSSGSSSPPSPDNTAELGLHSAQMDVQRMHDDLSALQSTIRDRYAELQDTASAPGPSLDGATDTLRSMITTRCDTLEAKGLALIDNQYVRERSGMESDVKAMLQEVQQIRDKVKSLQ